MDESVILWPETVHLPNLHRYANIEIEFLFTGQWNKWQRFADVVGLPQEIVPLILKQMMKSKQILSLAVDLI